jgi:hypothetical protein
MGVWLLSDTRFSCGAKGATMNVTLPHESKSHGELMNCLLKAHAQYANEAEFKAFALAEVRRFIVDLRAFDIEIAVRPNSGKLGFYSPKE